MPTWSIEEYTATYDDDDKDFVGSIDAPTGLFTPNLDGPNPKRRNSANNYRRRLGSRDVSGAGGRQRAPEDAEGTRAPARHRAALHEVGSAGGEPMIALERREFHLFQAAGRDFLYLVPSAAVFALDAATSAVLRAVSEASLPEEGVVQAIADRFDEPTARAAINELLEVRAIGYAQQAPEQPVKMLPMMPFPLKTMVLNVTNQCNLACTYCYEYGEDKIVDTENGKQSKFMSEATARDSVEFLLRE